MDIDTRIRTIKDDLRAKARRSRDRNDVVTYELLSTHIEILRDYDEWWVWHELYPPDSYLAYVEQMLDASRQESETV